MESLVISFMALPLHWCRFFFARSLPCHCFRQLGGEVHRAQTSTHPTVCQIVKVFFLRVMRDVRKGAKHLLACQSCALRIWYRNFLVGWREPRRWRHQKLHNWGAGFGTVKGVLAPEIEDMPTFCWIDRRPIPGTPRGLQPDDVEMHCKKQWGEIAKDSKEIQHGFPTSALRGKRATSYLPFFNFHVESASKGHIFFVKSCWDQLPSPHKEVRWQKLPKAIKHFMVVNNAPGGGCIFALGKWPRWGAYFFIWMVSHESCYSSATGVSAIWKAIEEDGTRSRRLCQVVKKDGVFWGCRGAPRW